MNNEWVENEFRDIGIRDNRLVKRLIKTVKSLSEDSAQSIPQALNKPSDIKATYRLLDNHRVSPEAIMNAHKEKTIDRIKSYDTVLIIQDTTTIDFTNHPEIKGIGLKGKYDYSKGFLLHSALAVTTQGVPLGVLSKEIWTRNPEEKGKSKNRHRYNTSQKESNKWLKSLTESTNGISSSIKTITICDRESDLYDFFLHAKLENKDFLVRAANKRKVYEEINSKEISGEVIVNIPRDTREKQPSREAVLSIKYSPITLLPSEKKKNFKGKPSLELYAVSAKEKNPPKGVKPIEWFLITSLQVLTLEDAFEKIQWYKERWKIERFHYILKSGCKIEELQFDTVERIDKAISLYMIIAWRILWFTYESRENPNSSCEKILEKDEWKVLYSIVNETNSIPNTPPSIKEITTMIAKLGGFMGRKGDGEPGCKVIWRGLRRLADILDGWRASQLLNLPIDVGNA